MSLYCNGNGCKRREECYRYTCNPHLPEEGFANGVWLVKENFCVNNDYCDGVFERNTKQ